MSADTNASCAPGIFKLTVKGAPSHAVFGWDFGKGQIPGVDTFNLIEPNPKKIDLTLYTFLKTGGVCTTVVKKVAEVYDRPTPQMTINQKTFCSTNQDYVLTDITKNSVFRIWTVEGSNYGDTAKSRQAQFTSDGKKNISLMVEDIHGCRAVKTFPEVADVIPEKKLTIQGTNTNTCVNSAMQFSIQSDLKPTEIKSIYWSFPNAFPTSSTALHPTNIRYSKGGQYDVSVEVSLHNGCTYNETAKKVAYPRDSTVLHISMSDSAVCTPYELKIVATNKNLLGPLTFKVHNLDSHLVDSISHVMRLAQINDAGEYDVQVTYQDTFCTSHFFKKKAVVAKQVFARISSNQHYDCEVPFIAKLNDNTQVSESGKLTYRWLVYDTLGNLITGSSQKNFEFVVKDSGYYDVELTVKHENGCADSVYAEKYIRGDSIRIDFDPISEVVCLNQDVIIQNSSLKSTYKTSDFFVWKLYRHGDTTKAIDSSYSKEPTFTAKYDDSYDIKVFAYNNLGCTQTAFRENVFEVDEPIPDFRIENPYQCPNDTFSVLSEITPSKGDYVNRWLFYNNDDTIKSNSRNPLLKIAKPGLYHAAYHISIFGLCRDTVVKTDQIGISGLDTRIALETNRACAGIPFKPKAMVKNYIYGHSDTTIQYKWTVTPAQGVVFSNDTVQHPDISFNETGNYTLRLICINASGCRDTAFSDTIFAGLRSHVVFSDTAVCSNSPISLQIDSDSFINKRIYSLTPDKSYALNNPESDSVSLMIKDQGSYRFSVIMSRDSVCFDTTTQVINIVSPTADFISVDSNLYCAPVYQRFSSLSTHADTFFWDFGDGKSLKTTFNNVTTVYEQNTQSGQGYTIQLIAKNKSGCSDTIIKPNFVDVKGPAVDFKLINNRGCEPLEVRFQGSTENVHKLYLDYGDGNAFGSSLNQPHHYTNSWRIIENKYSPVILVVDKNGCQTAVRSDSMVYVKPSPTAKMDVKDSIACAYLETRYYYVGNEATSWYWDFDGNGNADGNGAVGLHRYTVPGKYPLTLINSNKFDCHDTAVTNIHVVNPPVIHIEYDSNTCVNRPFQVADLSVLDTFLQQRLWTITSQTGTMTRSDSSFMIDAVTPQMIKLKLSLTDSMNCSASDSVFVRVKDSTNHGLAEIEVVTVGANNLVDLTLIPPSQGYLTTRIDKDILTPQKSSLATIRVDQNTYQDSFASAMTSPQCYQITHQDSCGFESKASETHCTIHLSVTSTSSGVNELSWTPYVGWSDLDPAFPYHIWRNDGEKLVLLAQVDGQSLQYNDSFLCDKNYCYTVVANHANQVSKSNSNIVCSQPIYFGNQNQAHVKLVTVKENQYVQLQMELDTGRFVVVKKFENGAVTEIPTQGSFYNDYEVDVHQSSYQYGVKQIDHCNNEGEVGRVGTSILLSLDKEDVVVTMHWNAYKQWEEGVKSYRIMRNEGNEFVLYKSVPGSDTNYTFNVGAGIDASNCFRVDAVSETGLISQSNQVCLQGEPIIFIPNAFSPFDHAVNNDFKPYVVFIKSPVDFDDGLYQFNIYDKWGGLLFATNDPSKGWDGTYMNRELPEGVYVYTFRVKGLDDLIRSYSGSVTLVR